MDGLRYVCSCCKEFCTAFPSSLFNAEELSYDWEMSSSFVADLGETYAFISDGMDNLWHMEEFPLTVRVGDYADVSVGGFLGDGLFGYEMNPISARLRKQDALKYRLWRTRAGHPSPELMARVFGEQKGQELTALASESMRECFEAIPSDRGFQTHPEGRLYLPR